MPILAIAALNLVLYIRTMKFLLVADDLAWYLKNRDGWIKFSQIKDLHHLKMWFFDRLYGGFTFGRNVSLDHLFTTALHTTASILIYLAFGANQVSFCAAILYSCNPLNNQTSIWLNGRRYVINIILVLSMILASNLSHGWAYSLPLYALTSFFQVTAIFAPILLVAKYPFLVLAIFGFLVFNYCSIVMKVNERYKKISDEDRVKFTPKRLIIITKVYGYYFFKMFFPGVCAMTYPQLHFWGQTKEGNDDAYSFNLLFLRGVSAFVLSIVCFAYFINIKDYQMAGFVAFAALSLLQWCHIVPVVQDLADRYTNVPNVFAMLFLSYFVHKFAGIYALPIITGFSAYYAAMLLIVMRMYRSEGARWEYQRHWFPQIPAPLKFEAEYLIHDRKDPLKAWVLIQEYLKHGTKDFTILFQAAKCHQAVGRLEEAKNLAQEATQHFNIGKEAHQKKMVDTFLANCVPQNTFVNQVTPSRQVKRAIQRKEAKEMANA